MEWECCSCWVVGHCALLSGLLTLLADVSLFEVLFLFRLGSAMAYCGVVVHALGGVMSLSIPGCVGGQGALQTGALCSMGVGKRVSRIGSRSGKEEGGLSYLYYVRVWKLTASARTCCYLGSKVFSVVMVLGS